MAPEHRQQFGRYELEARIGRGGMAETWRARLMGAAGVTKPVLIKKVLPEYATDEAFISMFISEARISATLSHGSIAQVFDFGRLDDEYFLAMEFVDGQPLNRIIKRALRSGFACLPLPIATFIALEMCRGLHYAHTRTDSKGAPLGIVHRDISPDNVLISYEGQVKIVDFGIAKARSLRSFDTAPGVVKGKYLFFSPEQARGEEVDARTDVWATAVVLYEMVCGKPPLSGPEYVVMHKLLKGEPVPRPRDVRPDLPARLDAILQKALAVNKEDRFESAHAFGDALAGFLYTSTPRFSPMYVAYLLRELFRQDMAEDGRDTRVPPTFVEELSVWLTSPNIPKPTEPAARQLTREQKALQTGPVDSNLDEDPDDAERNRAPEGLFANGFRISQYHLVVGGALLAVLALLYVSFDKLKADWMPPEAPARAPGPPESMKLAQSPPVERPAAPPRPPEPAVPTTADWPVESFQLDARQHVFRVSTGLAAPATLEPEVAWRVVEAPPDRLSRGKPMPQLFYLLTGGTVPAEQALGTVSRKAQLLHDASGLMVFTVGPPTAQEDLPERIVVVTNTQTGTTRRLTVHPEWMTPGLDKAFLLKGLDAAEPYRLTVEPVGEGAFTRARERGPMHTVACVQWLPESGGRTPPAKAQRFLLSQGEEARIGGMQGLRCGFIDDDPSDNAGAVRVRISRVSGARRPNPSAPFAQVVGTRMALPEPAAAPAASSPAELATTELSPADALLAEARALSRAGQHAQARARARECLKLEPDHAECHLQVGSAAVRLGNREEGARHYRRFLELARSDHPMASAVLRILQEYEAQPSR